MLRFCGFGFELFVDEVLTRCSDDPVISSATDSTGQHWLIVEAAVAGDGLGGGPGGGTTEAGERVWGGAEPRTADRLPDDISWVCAPASLRMIDMVRSGKATVADAVTHSQTGWVEMVSIVGGHSVPDRRIPCSALAATFRFPVALSA